MNQISAVSSSREMVQIAPSQAFRLNYAFGFTEFNKIIVLGYYASQLLDCVVGIHSADSVLISFN